MKKLNLQFGIVVLLAFILTLASGTLYGQSCPAGMTGYWKMSELSGPVYYDSFSNNDAFAPSASPSQIPGASGRGQQFQGSSETYLTIPDNPIFDWTSSSSFTIEFWVKYGATTGDVQVFLARDDRPYTSMTWWIGAQVNGTISWYMKGSVITTPEAYNDNQWHHVVALRNGATARNFLYVDGIIQNPGGYELPGIGSLASSNPVTFGTLLYLGKPEFHFNGGIDEVAFYNRVLDEFSEIQAHYNNVSQYQIGYCDGDDIQFLSEPVTKATVGQLYIYDVDASGNSKPTYTLVEKPDGMIIDSNTGMITWTPVSQSANGHVIIRATNDKGSIEQDFNIFLADAPQCRPNLLAYWDFNQAGNAGYVDHIAGWQFTGSAPTTTTGIAGSGLEFNGKSDSINLRDDIDPTRIWFDFDDVPTFSFEIWMKSDASPSETMVLVGRDQPSNNTHYWLGVNPDGTVGFRLRDYRSTVNSAYVEGGSVLDGGWHHIVASYNDATGAIQLFVDKILVEQTNKRFIDFGGNSSLNIGHLNILSSSIKYWYEGSIDELACYNVALNAFQVQNNYDNSIAGRGACIYNYAPVILSTPDLMAKEDTIYSYEFITMDINEEDILNLSVVSAPNWLSEFVYNPGDTTAVLSGIPGNDDVGIVPVTLRVFDGKVSVDQTFELEVVNVNDAPEFTSTPVFEVDQDALYSYMVLAMDGDGDIVEYSAPQIPEWLELDDATFELSGTPSNADVGIHNVTLRASDGILQSDQEFELTVINVNDAPEIVTDPITEARAGQPYLYQIDVVDPDPDDDLVFIPENIPGWMKLTPASTFAILSGNPTLSDLGAYVVVVKVSDGIEEDAQAFSITVLDPTGIEDANYLVNRVYPTPASTEVTFEFAELGDVHLKIIDITGSQVKEIIEKHTDKMIIDISDLSNSMYFYSVTINGKTSVGQLMKE